MFSPPFSILKCNKIIHFLTCIIKNIVFEMWAVELTA
jgi:hypothetical protein